MAELPSIFRPDETHENPFAPIPAGWYLAEIVKTELKDTRDKAGKYISVAVKVIEGEHEGRLVYTNLNIVNKSPQAVAIANADLKAICQAVGHEDELEDTEDLHNIPMFVKVSLKPETPNWPAKNEIKGYRSEAQHEEKGE